MDRSKGEKVVSDWHCHPSQRLLPEGIISDLVMPGMVGTPPFFLQTPLRSFSFAGIYFFSILQECYSPLGELKAWQWLSKQSTHLLSEFTYVSDRGWCNVDVSKPVCEKVWGKTSLSQHHKRATLYPPGLLMPCRYHGPLFISRVLFHMFGGFFYSMLFSLFGLPSFCDSCGWQARLSHLFVVHIE